MVQKFEATLRRWSDKYLASPQREEETVSKEGGNCKE